MKKLELKDFLKYKCLSALKASPLKSKAAFAVSCCNEDENCYSSYLYGYIKGTDQIIKISNNGREKTFAWLDDDTLIYPCNTLQDSENGCTVYYSYNFNTKENKFFMKVPLLVSKIFCINKNIFAIVADYDLTWPEPEDISQEEIFELIKAKKKRDDSYLAADELPFRFDGMGFRNNKRSRLFLFDKQSLKIKGITDKFSNIEFISQKGTRIFFSSRRFTKEHPRRFDLSGLSIYDTETEMLHEYADENKYRVRYVGFMGQLPIFMGSEGKRYGYQENPFFFYIDADKGKEYVFAQNELSASNAVSTDSRLGGGDYAEADEKYLYFVSTKGGNANIRRVSLEGNFEDVTDFVGSVDFISLLDDQILFIGMLDNKPQELYSFKNGKLKALTSFNSWVSDERSLSKPRVLNYENDSVSQTGYVIEPVDFDSSKKYPGILYIHGGHKMDFGPVFYHEMQLWANEGYFVFYTNPRGSDGYDNDFADIIGKYGYDDYSDLMKFTDEVLSAYPQIDEDRLGVGGGSYGGFMTNWIIGHTNRFKCAVSQRSISNFISMFGTGDTNYRFPMWDFETNPWMDVGRYWEHSPLKYADRAATPTLFIHSTDDYRCPVSEGIQMFTALRYHGVEARLCMFKGEGHELSRSGKPVNRVNRLLEITAWWDKYLK